MINEPMTAVKFLEAIQKSKESKKNGQLKTRFMTKLEKIKYGVQTSLMVI